jgi:hypothetical protein
MSSSTRWKFIKILVQVTAGDLGGDRFVRRFMTLRRENRDAQWKLKEQWPRPYDEELRSALLRNEISKEQFSERWEKLWGERSERNQRFDDAIDRVFTACDVFVGDENGGPTLTGQYDERQLREFVAKELQELVAFSVSLAAT